MILLLISFVAGVLTVLAPCTLPLLPVIVGGSVKGGLSKKRAIVITLSLALSLVVFTLLLKVSTVFISVPQFAWSWFSGFILTFLGLITVFPEIWERIPVVARMNINSNKLVGEGYRKKSLAGDMLMGAALGPVFSSCSPTYFLILATVLPQSPLTGLLYLIVYALGLSFALLVIAFLGQIIVGKLEWAVNPNGWFKKTLGLVFILLGVLIFFGIDKKIQIGLLESGIFDVTKIEQLILEKANSKKPFVEPVKTDEVVSSKADIVETIKDPIKTETSLVSDAMRLAKKSVMYKQAPELVNPNGFVNTDGKPITIGQFKGKKVVLLDIWTYSCINCQRTLPYVKTWYDKYSDEGLEIISLHTPEFSFEKVQKNVEDAVKGFGIKYPVVLDNEYATWNAYGNQYWPRKYLIDIDGYVVYDHIGEGGYEDTEKEIQKLLLERKDVLNADTNVTTSVSKPKDAMSVTAGMVNSPETYFGSSRNQYLANGKAISAGSQTLSIPDKIETNSLYLGGTWNFTPEHAEHTGNSGKIVYKFDAKNVYFVASSLKGVKASILLDGKTIGTNAGKDVSSDGVVNIQANRLYELVNLSEYGVHTLEIDIEGPGLDAFTFTFG